MKVKELIEELEKMDPELEVSTGDNDDWWYDTHDVCTLYIKHGKEQSEGDGIFVVGIS